MRYLLPVFALCFGSLAIAQENPRKAVDRSRGAKLQRVFVNMTTLKSVAFETSSTAPPKNAFNAGGKKTVKATGVWNGQILQLDLGGGNEVVFHGRHMIARDDDHEWCLRRDRLANGAELDFALDPSTLFTALAQKKHEVLHNEVGQVAEKPVEIYTITLEEDEARTLFWSGCVPKGVPQQNANAAGVVRFIALGGAFGRAAPKPDIKIDLAIAFDPAMRRILSIRGRAITKGGPMAVGGMVVRARRIGGAQQGGDENEDEEEAFEPGTFKNGLPVRTKKELKDAITAEFHFTFKSHDQVPPPELDAAARALLGIPRK